jgi:hypothetical protein
MWVLKQCSCGSTDFYDDCGTMRCVECDSVADLAYIPEKKESEEKDD